MWYVNIILQTCHFYVSSHNIRITKPLCKTCKTYKTSLCLLIFPETWHRTELTTLKPTECQFHQTYGVPVLRSKHQIKKAMIDGPAEAPAAHILTSCCPHLVCQNSNLSFSYKALLFDWDDTIDRGEIHRYYSVSLILAVMMAQWSTVSFSLVWLLA